MPKFVTSLYYGKVTISHFDIDAAVKIGQICTDALKAAGISTATFKIEWIDCEDGIESVDSTYDLSTKKWG